jgi:nucleoside-diphosphate-sugar epimerase
MQVVLGATGPIGRSVAAHLSSLTDEPIRLVSRHPLGLTHTFTQDNGFTIVDADLTDAQRTVEAIDGATTVYFVVGLPLNTTLWQAQFELMTQNVIQACLTHNAKLVFFDNTYMYPQDVSVLTEETPLVGEGPKGRVRANMTQSVLQAMDHDGLQALIARAPEFYGPGKTLSFTNLMVLKALRKGRKARVLVSDSTKRTLIHVEDAGKATALLGMTEDAFGQTWHLPCDDERMTYAEIIQYSQGILGRPCEYQVLKRWQLECLKYIKPTLAETQELWPRYGIDNIFLSDKFKCRFPDFAVTPYREGIKHVLGE